jgi:hypothetical protein
MWSKNKIVSQMEAKTFWLAINFPNGVGLGVLTAVVTNNYIFRDITPYIQVPPKRRLISTELYGVTEERTLPNLNSGVAYSSFGSLTQWHSTEEMAHHTQTCHDQHN